MLMPFEELYYIELHNIYICYTNKYTCPVSLKLVTDILLCNVTIFSADNRQSYAITIYIESTPALFKH